ncbi:MAG: NAD-dependent DNA ligase LigA [Lachnospiraceae bacterium]|nr:NAD-dependent DNA ligase LigA [Candidatus Equihabitans merdae]
MTIDKKARLRELVDILNKASKAYYTDDIEIMSNKEYDALYDELEALEKETGIVLADSPTINVGYEVRDELPKVVHEQPMLSLDKTKEVDRLAAFAGDQKCVLSWKMDGLTVVLIYEDGQLAQAITRGNGAIGEDVTGNARAFKNIPLRIPYKGRLVLRGEAIIHYSDFEKINASIADADAKYKNPRNLCSGSVRQLDAQVTADRSVNFYAFFLVSAPGVDFKNSRQAQFEWLKDQGFTVVEYKMVTSDSIPEAVAYFSEAIAHNDFPSDGLVLMMDDIAYGESLGVTAKFPRNAFAFKWQDATEETTLREVEWSPSRTGLINPVAIFDPVELEGTTVKRASLHNVSILRGLKLGIGDRITVYKANMIIPQISENLTCSDSLELPQVCPACGGATVVKTEGDVQTLYCSNPLCQAKQIRSYELFVSRDAMNIEGLSEATLEKLIAMGLIHEFADLFKLEEHRDTICQMEGFGNQSADNLLNSINNASNTSLERVICALGIPEVGVANAKVLCKYFDHDMDRIRQADVEELTGIYSFGPSIANAVYQYFHDETKKESLDRLLDCLTISKPEMTEEKANLKDKTFVITGSLVHYTNRNALKKVIEDGGGKVTGSVTKKTDYLINNDINSNSSKNKTAKELGIPIITEEQFMEMI